MADSWQFSLAEIWQYAERFYGRRSRRCERVIVRVTRRDTITTTKGNDAQNIFARRRRRHVDARVRTRPGNLGSGRDDRRGHRRGNGLINWSGHRRSARRCGKPVPEREDHDGRSREIYLFGPGTGHVLHHGRRGRTSGHDPQRRHGSGGPDPDASPFGAPCDPDDRSYDVARGRRHRQGGSNG